MAVYPPTLAASRAFPASRHNEIRPWGELSHFIIDHMPDMTEAWKTQKTDHLRPYISALSSLIDVLEADPHPAIRGGRDSDIALLDLRMLYNVTAIMGLDDFHGRLATVIESRAVRNGQNTASCLTYQDIVIANPSEDMRHFTAGPVGESEKRFYYGHQFIEAHFSTVINALKDIGVTASLTDADIHQHFSQARLAMREANEKMQRFRTHMDTAHFREYRAFFKASEAEKGASGAFSAKFPHIDLLLHGDQTPDEVFAYLDNNRAYFPMEDFRNLTDTRSDRLNAVRDRMKRVDISSETSALYDALKRDVLSFRRLHFGTTIKHLGASYDGSGEAGQAADFLQARIGAFENLKPTALG